MGGILWDSSQVASGTHTFTVAVEDVVGNRGEDAVALSIVPPLALELALASAQIPVSETAAITVDLSSFFGGTQVEVFVGNTLVGSTMNPTQPYRLDFSTAGLAPGVYPVAVRARDGEGHVLVDTSQTLTLTVPIAAVVAAPAGGNWWSGLTRGLRLPAWLGGTGALMSPWLLVGAGILLLFGLILAFFARLFRRKKVAPLPPSPFLPACRLFLTNAGNTATHYLLRAEDPAGFLRFEFMALGVPLLPPQAAQAVQMAPPSVPASGNGVAYAPAASPPPAQPPAAGTASAGAGVQNVMAGAKTAGTTVKKAQGALSFVAEFLDTCRRCCRRRGVAPSRRSPTGWRLAISPSRAPRTRRG